MTPGGNMRNSHLRILLATTCAAAVWTGCAGTAPPSSTSVFDAMDTNRDGKVSREEYSEARLREAFRKLDTKGDQVITLDEWKQFDSSREAQEHFRQLDENGDDKISVAEFLKLAPKYSNLDRLFQDMDLDRDNILSAEDLKRDAWLEIFSIKF
jgi:Ca2+-binding EF-hand superfamily protein